MQKSTIDPVELFKQEQRKSLEGYGRDAAWQELSSKWLERALEHQYMYKYSWMGRPIIQMPSDMVVLQEIIWDVKPDLVIEAGIAHGGSLIMSASLLALLDYCDAVEEGTVLDPAKPKRRVLGIDIDIRAHNKALIEAHPLFGRIDMIEGSSIEAETIDKVREIAGRHSRILVCLDSNHTHDHVMAELKAYAPLVSKGSYCVVFDTIVEDLPGDAFPGRPWSPGNNPKTAVHAFLAEIAANPPLAADGGTLSFEIDSALADKQLLSFAPDGHLRRT